MEVVSPLTFAHSNAGGNKRRFACADAATSPALGAPASSSSSPHHSADENMDDCSGGGGGGYGYHATKRRRKNNQDVAAATSGSSSALQKENNWSISPFLAGTTTLSTPGCHSPNSGKFIGDYIVLPSHFISMILFYLHIHSPPPLPIPANKRNRTTSPQHSFGFNHHHHHNSTTTHHQQQKIQELEQENENLRSQNQKVENENRILKRAVTIQQDRQHQLNEELEGARRFKEQAEERIRRLEQMNVTLQYQLQAQSSSAGNDFMGFSPRPPDVY